MKTSTALTAAILVAGVFGAQAMPPEKSGLGHGAAANVAVGKIEKAAGPDARTVAEVVTNRAALKDKTVTIRGQVVKVNSGILGKNWVHLQDGSGSATDGTHDILVTTLDTATVGEIVNARGTVRNDVSLGQGYAYAVLVDNAKIGK